MKISGFGVTALAVAVAGSVWAHTGATGIVKERMDGMGLMGFYVKDITPMMRGKEDYDAERVRAFARIVGDHSGEAMTKLFPEGSGGGVSEAKETIWQDWDEFEKLANRLGTLAEGLSLAADNGVKGGGAAGMMGEDSMMGGDAMMGGGAMMGAGGMMDELKPADLAEMPVDGVFQMVSQNCSACHTKFRVEK